MADCGDNGVILSIDIGTTNIKVAAIEKSGTILRLHSCSLKIQSPQPGWLEICPAELWKDTLMLLKKASEGLEKRIVTIGISTQRSTFITWNRETDEYLHNFITWMDRRAAQMCDDWNNSMVVRCGRNILFGLGKLFGSSHMICAASFKVTAPNVQMRLKWVMENIPIAQKLYADNKLCFGTLDTWLIYKLTGGATWATDYTNAAATGIYDLWAFKWCPVMTRLFSNPIKALPEVRDCNASYGNVNKDLQLGFSVPIYGVLADQPASVIGNKLFNKGDVKLTLGTCLTCDIITGSYVHPVATDVYPQIAWKLVDKEAYYLAESISDSGGKCLDLAVSSGLVDSIEDLDYIACSVKSTEGVSFMGIANSGSSVSDSMIGASDKSSNAHLVRAIMEAHVFKCKTLIDNVRNFYEFPDKIIADGGGSKSDFIIGNTAKLCQINLIRSQCVEGSLMGAFFMAGIGVGWWNSFEDIKPSIEFRTFPHENDDQLTDLSDAYVKWKLLNDN